MKKRKSKYIVKYLIFLLIYSILIFITFVITAAHEEGTGFKNNMFITTLGIDMFFILTFPMLYIINLVEWKIHYVFVLLLFLINSIFWYALLLGMINTVEFFLKNKKLNSEKKENEK